MSWRTRLTEFDEASREAMQKERAQIKALKRAAKEQQIMINKGYFVDELLDNSPECPRRSRRASSLEKISFAHKRRASLDYHANVPRSASDTVTHSGSFNIRKSPMQFLKRMSQRSSKPPLNSEKLILLLREEQYMLARVLINVLCNFEMVNEVVQAVLIGLMQAETGSQDPVEECIALIKSVLMVDIGDSGMMVLRTDSNITKVISGALNFFGKSYAERITASTHRLSLSIKNPPIVDDNGAFDSNTVNCISSLTMSMLNGFLGSGYFVPVELSRLLRAISLLFDHHILKKEVSSYLAVSTFLFLRFICPAIISTKLLQLYSTEVSNVQTKYLVYVCKIVQNVVNGIEFGEKERNMTCFNHLVRQFHLPIRQFVELHFSYTSDNEESPLEDEISLDEEEQGNASPHRIRQASPSENLKSIEERLLSTRQESKKLQLEIISEEEVNTCIQFLVSRTVEHKDAIIEELSERNIVVSTDFQLLLYWGRKK